MAFKIGLKNLRKGTANQRFIKMFSKRDGICSECEQDIIVGDEIIWDSEEFKVFCKDCGKDLE